MGTETARGRKLSWVWLVAVGVLFVIVYSWVTSQYDSEGGLKQSGGSTEIGEGFTAEITPIAIRPLTSTATMRLAFHWIGDDVVEDGRLGQNTRVTVITHNGVSETRYPAGTVPSAVEVEMGIEGEQSSYPFDTYNGEATVLVDAYEVASDGTITSTGPLPLALSAHGGVSGWNSTFEFIADPEGYIANFTFSRAFSTQAFAVLILVMSVVLAALALWAAVLMKTRRRIVEATLLSWAAALVFALPALRNFMPNGPPIGAAIDIYVYLWVMAAAVGAAALVILSWIQRDKPGRTKERGDDHAA